MSVFIKVVNCREEADKRYSILRGIFHKNDCAYPTKMKGGDDVCRIHSGVVYMDNVIPILYYGGLDWIRMGADQLERIVKNIGNY